MKKLVLALSMLCFLSAAIFAQSDRVDVTVIMKDGSTVEGMMEVNENYPWSTQKEIAVFDKSLVNEKKIKNKVKTKYKAKEIKAYESQGKYYESIKVMIAGRGDYGSTLKALPSYALIQRVTDGPISAYKAYAYPPGVASGVTFAEIYEDLRQNPEYFLKKESESKWISMHSANIEKWIADAPVVSEKFAKGEYGNMKRKEGKKMANFLKGQLENENPQLILTVVEEYNSEKMK